MALQASTIATAIKNLSITGVTVLDITEIPNAVDLRARPQLIPGPSWISGGIGSGESGEGAATFGFGQTPAAAAPMWVFQRVFQYRYFHAQAGEGRGLKDHFSAMSTNLDAIQTAFTTLNVTGVDVMEIDNSEFGIVNDPSEIGYYGFDIMIALKERINA